MLIISKYLLGTKSIETIKTREEHKILNIRLENEVSDPEIYILENTDTNEITKNILIVEDNVQLNYHIEDLKFINLFEFRKGLHKFFVFELLNNDVINLDDISRREGYSSPIFNNGLEEEIDLYKKYARVPKPDLDKVYSKEELEKMHPLKQLRFLLIQKYNMKNRICSKLSIEHQIEYILLSQEGKDTNPLSLVYEKPKPVVFNDSDIEHTITILSHSKHDPQLS